MANPEHLEILKQGVEQWNKWRKEHPVRRDLDLSRRSDLARRTLAGRISVGRSLRVADLGGADLRGADLREAKLSGREAH